jgi:hypothetical protein
MGADDIIASKIHPIPPQEGNKSKKYSFYPLLCKHTKMENNTSFVIKAAVILTH